MVRILLVLLFFINTAFAAIQVRVNKTQISSIDNLNVIIRIDNLPSNQALNLNALKADFNIINQSKSSSFSTINGKISSVVNLQLTLQPKRTGELTIPALKAGGQISKAVAIKVTEVNEASFESNILFIKTQLDNATPMVQQQVIYTVDLYSRLNIQRITLDFTPQITGAKVQKIAESKLQKVDFKGQKLWKKTFNFAIYPQKTGKLSIPGIKQLVTIAQPQRSEILLFSQALNLTAMLAHISYPAGQYWLPASSVEISEKPFDKGQKIIAGEPFVRQIIVKVSAQSASQVPLIQLPDSTLFEQYADSDSNTEKVTHNNIISTSVQNILLIANHSGEQTLPEISLTWFDTTDNKTKVARLPAVKVQVGAPLAQPKTLVVPEFEDKDITLSTVQKEPTITRPTYWKPIAIFSIILWLLTLLFCWFFRQSKPKEPAQNKKIMGVNQLKMIKEHANKNDAKAVKNALDAWIFEQYNLLDSNSFATELGDEFACEMLILQQSLYKSNAQWDGQKFYEIFSKAIKKYNPKKQKQTLSDLYPNL